MSTKQINRALARAIRKVVEAEGLNPSAFPPNGRLWGRAKDLLKAGATIRQAAWHAVHAEAQARVVEYHDRPTPKVTRKPVTQVQAPARKLNAQQERVRKGEVMRDSKGRLVSRATQELVEFLTSA